MNTRKLNIKSLGIFLSIRSLLTAIMIATLAVNGIFCADASPLTVSQTLASSEQNVKNTHENGNPSNVLQPATCASIGEQSPFQEKGFELALYTQFGLQAGLQGDWINALNDKLAQLKYQSRFDKSDNNSLFASYPALRERI